jgi:hypothetical protein
MRLLLALLLLSSAPAGGADLPNPLLTPGVVRQEITLHEVCHTRWGKDVRHVTQAMKKEVFRRYGIAWERHADFETDHLIPRELGGADDLRNLFPQEWPAAHRKDRVENRARREVCAGRLTLDEARGIFLGDWRAAFTRYYGEHKVAER